VVLLGGGGGGRGGASGIDRGGDSMGGHAPGPDMSEPITDDDIPF
jgi:hypothetical protein